MVYQKLQLKTYYKQLERVDKYKYLRVSTNSQSHQDDEIKSRIEIAQKEFVKHRSTFTHRKLILGCDLTVTDHV